MWDVTQRFDSTLKPVFVNNMVNDVFPDQIRSAAGVWSQRDSVFPSTTVSSQVTTGARSVSIPWSWSWDPFAPSRHMQRSCVKNTQTHTHQPPCMRPPEQLMPTLRRTAPQTSTVTAAAGQERGWRGRYQASSRTGRTASSSSSSRRPWRRLGCWVSEADQTGDERASGQIWQKELAFGCFVFLYVRSKGGGLGGAVLQSLPDGLHWMPQGGLLFYLFAIPGLYVAHWESYRPKLHGPQVLRGGARTSRLCSSVSGLFLVSAVRCRRQIRLFHMCGCCRSLHGAYMEPTCTEMSFWLHLINERCRPADYS